MCSRTISLLYKFYFPMGGDCSWWLQGMAGARLQSLSARCCSRNALLLNRDLASSSCYWEANPEPTKIRCCILCVWVSVSCGARGCRHGVMLESPAPVPEHPPLPADPALAIAHPWLLPLSQGAADFPWSKREWLQLFTHFVSWASGIFQNSETF